MRRFLATALICLCAAPTASSAATEAHNWHGIWMNGLNVVWIATGPTDHVQVAAAAYYMLGPQRYLDAQVTFMAVPDGDSITLSPATADGCAIELTYVGDQIAAHDNGRCTHDRVTFDGTYDRQ